MFHVLIKNVTNLPPSVTSSFKLKGIRKDNFYIYEKFRHVNITIISSNGDSQAINCHTTRARSTHGTNTCIAFRFSIQTYTIRMTKYTGASLQCIYPAPAGYITMVSQRKTHFCNNALVHSKMIRVTHTFIPIGASNNIKLAVSKALFM